MHNLLSPEEKKLVRREYYVRLASVFLVFVLCTLFIALFFLYPSYVISKQREVLAARNEEIFIQSVEVRDEEALSKIIASTKQKMDALEASEEKNVSALVKAVLEKKRPGIRVTDFTIKTEEGTRTITLGGVASSRIALRSFVKDLEAVSFFKDVRIPVSDYADETNIDFSIFITPQK